jgi:hypothetical protein
MAFIVNTSGAVAFTVAVIGADVAEEAAFDSVCAIVFSIPSTAAAADEGSPAVDNELLWRIPKIEGSR